MVRITGYSLFQKDMTMREMAFDVLWEEWETDKGDDIQKHDGVTRPDKYQITRRLASVWKVYEPKDKVIWNTQAVKMNANIKKEEDEAPQEVKDAKEKETEEKTEKRKVAAAKAAETRAARKAVAAEGKKETAIENNTLGHRVENITEERREKQNAAKRVENMTEEQYNKKMNRGLICNMSREQIDARNLRRRTRATEIRVEKMRIEREAKEAEKKTAAATKVWICATKEDATTNDDIKKAK